MDKRNPEETRLLRAHRRVFSRLGFALLLQLAAMLAVQAAVMLVVRRAAPALGRNPLFLWLLTILSAYGVAFPLFCRAARSVPAAPMPEHPRPLNGDQFLKVCMASMVLMYLTNFATLLLMKLIESVRGQPVINPVDSLQNYPMILNFLMSCIGAPIVEEVTFRGILLRRLRPYGEKFAVVASALCFGLFHGNLNQFFYATALGILFALVMVRTGCLWQTMLLHALINLVGGVLIPASVLLSPRWTQLLNAAMMLVILVGAWCLLQLVRSLRFREDGFPLPEPLKWRLFFLNPGMLLFCAAAAVEISTCFL